MERGTRATQENRGADAAARYRGERAGDRDGGGTGRRRRPTHVLQIEDLLLGGWVFGIEELVRRGLGDPFQLFQGMTAGDAGHGWLDWLRALTPTGWVLVSLFLFVLLTRGPEDTDRDVALGRRWPMLGLALPILSIYALIASAVQQALFGSPDLQPGQEPPWPGPYLPSVVRRTAGVPIAFLGDALFRAEIAHANIDAATAPLQGLPSPQMLLVMLASAFPYMIFVAGPRIAAGGVLAWRPWILRFVFFYLAMWAGIYRSW